MICGMTVSHGVNPYKCIWPALSLLWMAYMMYQQWTHLLESATQSIQDVTEIFGEDRLIEGVTDTAAQELVPVAA